MATKHTTGTCGEHKLSLPTIEEEEPRDPSWGARAQRAQWLRAAILGATDGLLSTTSLMLGVGAAKEDHSSMILSGLSGAVAGACSMALGEFVSVSTQRDIEEMGRAEDQFRKGTSPRSSFEMCQDLHPPVGEEAETRIKISTGDRQLPEVASPAAATRSPKLHDLHLMSPGRSPLARVSREDAKVSKREGLDQEKLPSPLKAAGASGLAFICGSLVPLGSTMFLKGAKSRIVVLVVVTSIALAVFGGLGAHLGGSRPRVSAVRVLAGGCIAMAITYGLMKPFDGDD